MTLNEAKIEEDFIKRLQDLKYTYRSDIRDRIALEKNFREKFEALNFVKLSDSEFAHLLETIVSVDVFKASQTLRERNTFTREDGTPLQYTLVNIKDWCKNEFEVINQLRINTTNSHHRYDVILLINGVPVVQVELKTLEVNPRRAMEQIVEYKNDAGNGYTNTLLCFMQLFIVSNRSNTYYFANNHKQHFQFNADERFLPIYQMADEHNNKITHLHDFTEKFLSKCKLGELVSRYMVLVVNEQKLMIMRPYQIYAVKAIVDCIKDNRGNGYVWHTTGSGKTLTSFKASTLLKENNDIHKCLFVVDRKDLDRQTREEFNRFQEGCVEQNTNTGALVKRLLSDDHADKVIVTTIQKLGIALTESKYKEKLESLSGKRMAIIFDECHRSQVGENHKAIKGFFPKVQLFGFTGTPIFSENASYKKIDGTEATFQTTEDIFEKELHSYTITNAIDDRNVLRFHIDYFKPDKQQVMSNGVVTKEAIVRTILEKHDKATNDRRFNAIFATASINDAIDYYEHFNILQKEKAKADESFEPLNLVCVFSPPAGDSQDVKQLQEDLPQESLDNQIDPNSKRQALEVIMSDYNKKYGTNHTVNEFDLYYQDVQKRIKDQRFSNQDYAHKNKIDIVIVVDMLLTGFDSKYLNTLYVDKNLKYHGLIQAFSRTNRVLNDTKPYGNILDFRGQQNSVDDAVKLFSGKDEGRAREIWLVESAGETLKKYTQSVANLENFMRSQEVEFGAQGVANLKGDEARIEFIEHFKTIQRLRMQLDQYTDLTEVQSIEIKKVFDEEELRSFKAQYLDVAQNLRTKRDKSSDDIGEDLKNIDFEFVLFSSAVIDYDYIMKLVAQYSQAKPEKQKMAKDQLIRMLSSDAAFMGERDDLIAYINSLKLNQGMSAEQIKNGYNQFKNEKNKKDLEAIALNHGLDFELLSKFIENIIGRMIFDGEELTDLMAPLKLGWKDRIKKEEELMGDLVPVLKKIVNGREISGLAAYE